MDFIIKEGDTTNALTVTLDSDETLSLETVSKVHFIMCDTTYTNKISREVDALDLPEASVVFTDAELIPGQYFGEFAIEYVDGDFERYPQEEYINIHILRNCGDIVTEE